jgi:predicted dehydrogenase
MINGLHKRILLIGAGKMGDLHLRAFKHTGLAEICGIVSRTEQSAQKLCANHNINYFSTDLNRAIDYLKPDGIVLAASHLDNHSILNNLLKFKIPILIEKPVGIVLSEVEKTLKIVETEKIDIMVGVNRRFYSTVTQSLFSLEFGGGITGIHASFPDPKLPFELMKTYDQKVYDNWIMMNTIHGIDILRLFGGEVKNLTCYGNKTNNISCIIEFQKGFTATLGLNENYGGMNNWKLLVEGHGMNANFNSLENLTINFDTGTSIEFKEITSKIAPTRPGLHAQAKAFISLIETGFLAYPGSDLKDHYKTLKLVDSIQQYTKLN